MGRDTCQSSLRHYPHGRRLHSYIQHANTARDEREPEKKVSRWQFLHPQYQIFLKHILVRNMIPATPRGAGGGGWGKEMDDISDYNTFTFF